MIKYNLKSSKMTKFWIYGERNLNFPAILWRSFRGPQESKQSGKSYRLRSIKIKNPVKLYILDLKQSISVGISGSKGFPWDYSPKIDLKSVEKSEKRRHFHFTSFLAAEDLAVVNRQKRQETVLKSQKICLNSIELTSRR